MSSGRPLPVGQRTSSMRFRRCGISSLMTQPPSQNPAKDTLLAFDAVAPPRRAACSRGLVGKGLEQLDLLSAKWTHLGPANDDRVNCHVASHQRMSQYGADTEVAGKIAALRVLVDFGLQISDVNRRSRIARPEVTPRVSGSVGCPTGAEVGNGP